MNARVMAMVRVVTSGSVVINVEAMVTMGDIRDEITQQTRRERGIEAVDGHTHTHTHSLTHSLTYSLTHSHGITSQNKTQTIVAIKSVTGAREDKYSNPLLLSTI